MRMHDPYIERESAIHRTSAHIKLLAAITLIISAVAIPRRFYWGYVVLAAILVLTSLLSRLPIAKILKRLILMEPFVVGISFLSLFQPDGGAVFVYLVVRGSLSLAAMVLLVATTRFTDLIAVLRKARLPWLLVTTLSLMYRYLFVIVAEADRMSLARASRNFVGNRRFHWRNLSDMIGFLFVRVVARAERIYAAMCARGWNA
jgi:cobalt/nickel transport system permease protein